MPNSLFLSKNRYIFFANRKKKCNQYTYIRSYINHYVQQKKKKKKNTKSVLYVLTHKRMLADLVGITIFKNTLN